MVAPTIELYCNIFNAPHYQCEQCQGFDPADAVLESTCDGGEPWTKSESESRLPMTFKTFPSENCNFWDVVKAIRSKNSESIRIDVGCHVWHEGSVWARKNASILTNEQIRELFHLQSDDIIKEMFFQSALAWKCAFKRLWEIRILWVSNNSRLCCMLGCLRLMRSQHGLFHNWNEAYPQ
jgi:hypothetical protein